MFTGRSRYRIRASCSTRTIVEWPIAAVRLGAAWPLALRWSCTACSRKKPRTCTASRAVSRLTKTVTPKRPASTEGKFQLADRQRPEAQRSTGRHGQPSGPVRRAIACLYAGSCRVSGDHDLYRRGPNRRGRPAGPEQVVPSPTSPTSSARLA